MIRHTIERKKEDIQRERKKEETIWKRNVERDTEIERETERERGEYDVFFPLKC